MRNNQPVIDKEYDVLEGQILVSKTDLAGTITECNDAFEAASGYSRMELIGQPHNMIRHPDVPPAVFADMWQDLKKGIPWTQLVKNRRKDGGFYWVKARATPIYKEGKISGYMSVRSRISVVEKQAAMQAYRDIQSGKAKIKHGQVKYGIDASRFNMFGHASPAVQLGLIAILLAFIPSLLGLAGVGLFSPLFNQILALALVAVLVVYGLKMSHTQKQTLDSLHSLASSQPLSEEAYDPSTYSGRLRNAIMSTNLAFLAGREESAYQLDRARQLQMALDKLQSNVMMADANFNIMYLNDNIKSFLINREAKLKQVLPAFDAKNLIGKNIDIFHKNPAHQRAMLAQLTEPFTANIEVAGYYFELAMLPISNRTGIRTATLVEWRDRTQEVQLLQNVKQTVHKAQKGYLGDRIDLSKVEGVAQDLSRSINELLDAIQNAMSDVIKVTTGMADGDLTQTIENEFEGELGELTEAINSSISRLDGIVSVAVEAASVVDSAAKEVSQGSHDLSERVQQQAAALEQTSATMDEMNSTIQHNTQNANSAVDVAREVQRQATQGSQVMTQTITAMNAIQESSHKIADIVSLIDGIAFQTNLLALNAAVEAARAGEHGRGFAVVAGEVRSLAQKSAEAAKDIKQLITESVNRIDQGTRLAGESGEVLTTVTGSIDQIAMMIGQIAKASNEQAQGIHQVHDAINSIDQVTQQNAALVEETTAAAESMSEQARILSQDMAFFKTTGNHKGALLNTKQAKGLANDTRKVPATSAKPVASLSKASKPSVPASSPSKADKSDDWAEF